MRRIMIAIAGAVLLAASTVSGFAQDQVQGRINATATFSILADFVKAVGGDRVDVTALVGPNSDAHVYAGSPADSRKLAGAKVIFTNGLGFEGWIDRLVKASGTKADIVVATKGIKARSGGDGHGHSHGKTDPHAWQSVANAKIYVGNIRDALIKADPAGATTYTANAAAYLAKLDVLDAEIKAAVASIPPARRKIITTHDAFGYFEGAYGVDFVAPQGVSTDAEASARDIARIITQIRTQKIPAVFLENVTDQRLIKRIADEGGAKIGGRLFSDALSDSTGPAPTYIDMMKSNIRELTAALTS